jgi:hypothetical protein
VAAAVAVATVELAVFVAVKIVAFADRRFGRLEIRPFSTNKADAEHYNRLDYCSQVVIARILFRKICKN